MFRFALAAVCLVMLWGCEEKEPYPRSQLDQKMFGPAAIRIQPTFTEVNAKAIEDRPVGIEAALEVLDQFDEPTRATGRAMFELYEYRRDSPQVRGRRIGGPWEFYLNTTSEQQEYWDSPLRAYAFPLPYSQVSPRRYYVLTAQFDLNAGGSTTRPSGRLFDQLIIAPQEEGHAARRVHAPSRNPGR